MYLQYYSCVSFCTQLQICCDYYNCVVITIDMYDYCIKHKNFIYIYK